MLLWVCKSNLGHGAPRGLGPQGDIVKSGRETSCYIKFPLLRFCSSKCMPPVFISRLEVFQQFCKKKKGELQLLASLLLVAF